MRQEIFVFSAFAALAWAAPAAAQTVECSRVEASGERTLCHEVVLPASAAEVWALWATTDGLASWVAPVAAIEPAPGGMFESSYDRNARIGDAGNIRNRVVAIVPQRLLVIQIAAAPPGFPHVEDARELTTLIELEPLGARETRVRVSMLGYREGAGFDALYAFFARGNDFTLQQLRRRVTQGPTDWAAAAH